MSANSVVEPEHTLIVVTDDAADLAQVRRPEVQAVICVPLQHAPWEAELATAVEGGAFVIRRCSLLAGCSELADVLEHSLSLDGLRFETRLALIDDLLVLAERLATIACCRGLMLRLFTEPPSVHCGFHVDTVGPGVPPFGLLKVYNGQGTHYVKSADVTRMHDFYDYLSRRERLAREWRGALDMGQVPYAEHLRTELEALDTALPFLRSCAPVREVPVGATVAFRHLDVRQHWSEHGKECAWIHSSPNAGTTRLVANLTPLDGPAGRTH